jgi:hypothetical protein
MRLARLSDEESEQEAAMPVAQVIRFDERQQMGRPRRKQAAAPCVILRFPASVAVIAVPGGPDEDRIAGRGRDPG